MAHRCLRDTCHKGLGMAREVIMGWGGGQSRAGRAPPTMSLFLK